MAVWTDIRRIIANAMGRPIPKQRMLKKAVAKKVTQQGDLAPMRIGADGDEPELGQMVKQLYSHHSAGAVSFPVRTEVFGPYNPQEIPIWVIKMIRRDFVARLAAAVFKGPLLKASRYHLVGGDAKTRGFTEHYSRPLLPKLLRTSLNAMDFGFQAHEIVYDESLPTVNFNIEGGGTAQIRNAVIPRAFVDIDPENVELYVDPDTGRFEGIEVAVFSAHSQIWNIEAPKFIPAAKVLLNTYQMEFSQFRGHSWYIPGYNPWWWKNVGYMYWGRFHERLGMGVYKGRAPNEKRPDRQGVIQSAMAMITGLLLNLRQGGVITIPHEVDDKGNQKYDVELLESKNNGEGFEKWIAHLTISMMRGLMIPDLLAIQDGPGSFAGKEVVAEQFFATQDSVVDDTVVEPYNQQVVAPNIRYNFGNNAPIPRYVAAPLNPAIRKNYFDLIKLLVDAPVKDNPKNKKSSILKPDGTPFGKGVGEKKILGPDGKPVAPTKPDENLAAFPPKPGAKPGEDDNKEPSPEDMPEPAKEFTLKGALDIIRIAESLDLPLKLESEWIETGSETPLAMGGANAKGKPPGFSKNKGESDSERNGPRDPTGDRK